MICERKYFIKGFPKWRFNQFETKLQVEMISKDPEPIFGDDVPDQQDHPELDPETSDERSQTPPEETKSEPNLNEDPDFPLNKEKLSMESLPSSGMSRDSSISFLDQETAPGKSPTRPVSVASLFEDPDFPLNKKTLPLPKDRKNAEWIRASELSRRLVRESIFVPEESNNGQQEVYQGQLGNCWLIPGMTKLTAYPKLFDLVVQTNQSFGEDYSGRFCFNLWNFGCWEEVVVDDRIPVMKHDVHFSSHYSLSPNVFWPQLLEKAFAKSLKSYQGIVYSNDALTSLTGGICETFFMDGYKVDYMNRLIPFLLKAIEEKAMICAGTPKNKNLPRDAGLFETHMYSMEMGEILKQSDWFSKY